MSLFKTQSLFTIVAKTGYADLASAEVTRILYKKPGGTTGYWQASVSGESLIYQVQNGDIDVKGRWSFQAYIELGGLKGYGSMFTKEIDQPIL